MQDESSLQFLYNNMKSTIDDPAARWQHLLRIEVDFKIYVFGRLFYDEMYFTIVEFLDSYYRWRADGAGDFIFNTMESEEMPFIAFYREAAGLYRPFAFHQNFEAVTTISEAALFSAFETLTNEVVREAEDSFSIRVDAWRLA